MQSQIVRPLLFNSSEFLSCTPFTFFILKQRKVCDSIRKENSRPIRCGAFVYYKSSYDESAVVNSMWFEQLRM